MKGFQEREWAIIGDSTATPGRFLMVGSPLQLPHSFPQPCQRVIFVISLKSDLRSDSSFVTS